MENSGIGNLTFGKDSYGILGRVDKLRSSQEVRRLAKSPGAIKNRAFCEVGAHQRATTDYYSVPEESASSSCCLMAISSSMALI